MSRIEDLEGRLAKDPNSKIFAQLAEEYRKAGRLDEAIHTCREGLQNHPNYFSARVALGRALLESGSLEEASQEFEAVLVQVPDNILANKFLGETYQQLGRVEDALAKYRVAQILAPEDADLAARIQELESRPAGGQVGPVAPPPLPSSQNAEEPQPFAEEPRPLVEDPQAFEMAPDPSNFEPEVEPTLVEAETESPPPPPPSQPPPMEPEREQVFEFEDSGGTPIQPAPVEPEKAPPTMVERQASEIDASQPISGDAQAIQDEIEQSVPTHDIGRQAGEIRDAARPALPDVPGEPVTPLPQELVEPGVPVEPERPPAVPDQEPPMVIERASEPPFPPAPVTAEGGADPAASPKPTATLAELYASQGHLEQALAVYRELVASQPADPEVRQRMDELTMLVQARAEAAAPPSSPPETVSRADVDAMKKTLRLLEGWLAEIKKA
jgi:tetratricopeptide (TPR) repeat protein